MDRSQNILRSEFNAEDGSFLLKLRGELEWDRGAFAQLLEAMYEAADANRKGRTIEKWIAEGFWYAETFVPEWSKHPSFPRQHSDAYYAQAYELLHDLAYFLFKGETPYEDEATLRNKIIQYIDENRY